MSELSQPWSVPRHWRWSSLGCEAEVVGGGTPSTKDNSNYEDGQIPWITPADLSGYHEKYIDQGRRNITEKGLRGSGARLLPANTVLFSSRAPIGYVAIAQNEVATNQGFKSFIPGPNLSSEYLYFYLKRAKELALQLASGTTFPEISGKKAREIPVPVPPLDEQKQIAEAIETQFARLDDAVAALQRARTRLKRYRASVLKAACEGRLVPTEAELARQEGRNYEPASVLLERIRAEREAAPGKKRGRARAVTPLDTSSLPELPEGWAWTTLSEIAGVKGGITKGQKRKPGQAAREVPYLRVANVQRGFLDLSEVKLIEAAEQEIAELNLQPGDILFNEGGDRDKLGRGWIWQGQLPKCIHQNHVFRARLYDQAIEPKYISWYGNTFGQQYFMAQGKQTTNLASINLSKLNAFPIPLPPLDEQERIIAEVERRLSVIEQMETTVAANRKRTESLRQSILRLAFSGRLVQPV